jgi:enoyl-[acyl-carrier-protein] reductase (NADH)
MRSMVYDFVPFRGSHTGELIFETFDEAIARVRGRVHAIALDNASNNDAFIELCIQNYENFTCTSSISYINLNT